MAFIRRLLNLTFRLGEGAFGESGFDTVTLSGLRATSNIVKAGMLSMGTANLQVFGMTLSLMNKLSTLGMAPTLTRRNTITIEAGDDTNGMGTVFIGTITNAWGGFSSAPNVPFTVEAHAGQIESVAPAPVSSFRGPANVVTIMSGLATQMNLHFENNGVTGPVLSNPYFSGSAREQAQACATAGGIEWVIDNLRLAIWPSGQSRRGNIPLISPATGMKGYPAFTSRGVMLDTSFNPSVSFGSKIKVESDLVPACGEWIVINLKHDLDTLVPDGKWFSTIEAARPGFVWTQ